MDEFLRAFSKNQIASHLRKRLNFPEKKTKQKENLPF